MTSLSLLPDLEYSLSHRLLSDSSHSLSRFYQKILHCERLSKEEALEIYNSPDLLGIGMLADTARRLKAPENEQNYVYWVHNLHINPTNICEAHCRFCAFKKGPKSPKAYVMSIDDVLESVHSYAHKDTLSEFHIVAGLYDKTDLAYYADLFKALGKHFPHVQIKALTAVEIDYLAQLEGISWEETLKVLIDAGLQAMPGGGAEVFSERVRKLMCADKLPKQAWLDIHGLAHGMGIKSNATLLAGLGETAEERVDHILAIREQQDKSGGFLSFIPLNCYYENTPLDPSNALTGIENLKNFALSRLILDNVPHIKSFWIHIGEKISQVALQFGVDDIDGTVVQEKIAHSAGTQTSQTLTKDALLHLVRQAGKNPVERDVFYNIKHIYGEREPMLTPPETFQWSTP
jgi:aminodeoxyfutalosine synthase